jgi:2-polyprenyl-3-methyl-5-hydroxy-6-metoxy-1,4-benzoquinol methylase
MEPPNIDEVNRDFYNSFAESFNEIPFETILPGFFLKYTTGRTILEIGSGPGALGAWLRDKGYEVTCLEPAEKLAERAVERGLAVHPLTIQEFKTALQFDCVVAISSLIHVPKTELNTQIKKIVQLLNPHGIFIASFIEGINEGFEDPTKKGKLRYFSKWTEKELDQFLLPYFNLLEHCRIYNKIMDRTFLLKVCALKNT